MNILITTDFSTESYHTLQYVLDLIKDTHVPCCILLVNTYNVPQTDPARIIALNDELKLRSKAELEHQRIEAMKKVSNKNISIELASHLGTLANVIRHLLTTNNIDLVAMGKNSGRHVESVAELLKQKQCPLLITHAGKAFEKAI